MLRPSNAIVMRSTTSSLPSACTRSTSWSSQWNCRPTNSSMASSVASAARRMLARVSYSSTTGLRPVTGWPAKVSVTSIQTLPSSDFSSTRSNFRRPRGCVLMFESPGRVALRLHRSDLEADVGRGRRVREPPDRDEVDARIGVRLDGLEGDASRSLKQHAVAARLRPDEGDGFRKPLGRHVIEEDRVDAAVHRLFEVVEGPDLDLDAKE